MKYILTKNIIDLKQLVIDVRVISKVGVREEI